MRIKPDIVEEWLKENDPEYGKRKYYMTNNRFLKVQRWEYPTAQMDKTMRRACV